MAPQDDLTAERATIIGEHYECEDSWYSCPVSDEGCANPGAGEECTCGVDTRRILLDKLLKTARQEALRAARQTISKLFDENTSGTPEYYCALLDAGNALDRLASEGGMRMGIDNAREWA